MTDTPIWTAEEQNIEYAKQLAEALIRLDGHSAQLRLVHSGPLRDGEFDLARLQLIWGHLADILGLVDPCLCLASQLTPTVTIEAASPQAEKEIEK